MVDPQPGLGGRLMESMDNDKLPRLVQEGNFASGVWKAELDDFRVEEIPAYEPLGEGPHVYLWVQKRGKTTPDVVKLLAKHFRVPERDLGYAGLKDKQGVTTQYFSIPLQSEDAVSAFSHPEVQVLRVSRHRNKLKVGHLRGNRFSIRVRDVKNVEAAQRALALLTEKGVPNYFGAQRFGRAAENAQFGRALLRGERLPKAPDRFLRKMYLSAAQAELFNEALAERLRNQTFEKVFPGDVMKKEDSGGEFVCEDVAEVSSRFHRFEVSTTGPLFGPKMTKPTGEVAQREARLLEAASLSEADFERGGHETQGARRPFRVRLVQPELEPDGTDVWVRFTLTSGSYATVVLRELFASGNTR